MGNSDYDEKGLIFKGQTQLLLLYPLKFDKQEIWSPTFFFKFSFQEPLSEIFELLRIRTDTNEVYTLVLTLDQVSGKRVLWLVNDKSKTKIQMGALFQES